MKKRLLSWLLCAAMVLGLLPTMAVTALADELAEAYTLSDDYISVSVSKKNGGFTVRTVEGDRLKKSDNNKELLYHDGQYDTSFVSFRVEDNGSYRDYIFGGSYTGSSAQDDLTALKKLWDTAPPTPLPEPDIIPVQKVALSQHTLELPRLSSADLSVSITPPDATDQTVLWSASPEDVVSVEAGRVTGLKRGSAVVTAVSDTKSDSCTVTVTPAVYRIETAHDASGSIPAWDAAPSHAEFSMPLTAKKSGLLLRALEFRIKGFVAGKMRAILRRYGSTTPLVDLSLELIRGYNDVVLDMGGFPLEKGVEYQLYMSAVNNFYPPSVEAGWVEENDFIDIAHGSAYYDGDTTLIFAGTVVLREAD